jgi:hypothetical protein
MLTMPFYEKLKESGLVIRYDDDEKIPNNSDLQYKIGDLVVLVVDKKPKAIVKVLESPMKVQSNLDLFKIFNNGGLSIPINQGIYFSKCEWYEPRKEEKFPKYKFDKANRKVVSEDFVGLVFDFWEKRIKINQGTTQILGNSTNDFLYPDESNLILDINLKEGSKQTIHVNKYERNQEARQKCIAHYGPNCQVCNFDFEVMYPSIGQGFIHVHHHKLISNSDGEYIIDPIKDLIPVCPNCHAMLHRKSPDQPYTVNELKNIMGIN